jgi:aspartyl-tRNA(Asn)/glutamyl-tRNA(Gln) amidotransferase subunit C
VPLSPHHVARLADLARIELSLAELEELAGQLDVILDAVAVVSQAAGEDVVPTSHALPLVNVFRSDQVTPSLTQAEVLAMAPAREDGRFRVPRILDEEA